MWPNCRGEWNSVKVDEVLKDSFLGRFGVVFEDYTQSGAKYAFIAALCTVATSFFLGTASAEAASVLVFLIYFVQFVLLVVLFPFNNPVINSQEIAAGFFNLITLIVVAAGVHQDASDLFESAMYLQIFVIIIKGFPGVIAAGQAIVMLVLWGIRFYRARQAVKQAEVITLRACHIFTFNQCGAQADAAAEEEEEKKAADAGSPSGGAPGEV